MKLKDIKPNPNNPRQISKEKFDKLCNSIKAFPKMMKLRPIVTDENNVILGGNMRLKVLEFLGYDDLPEGWVVKEKNLTDEEKNEFIIKDNVGFGDWEYDELANSWDVNLLNEWGLDFPDSEEQKDKKESEFVCPECNYQGVKSDFNKVECID